MFPLPSFIVAPSLPTQALVVFMRFLILLALLFAGAAQADVVSLCLDAYSDAEAAKTADLCGVALKTGQMTPGQPADDLISLGVAERNLGQLEDSAATLKSATNLAPRNARALRILDWTCREQDTIRRRRPFRPARLIWRTACRVGCSAASCARTKSGTKRRCPIVCRL